MPVIPRFALSLDAADLLFLARAVLSAGPPPDTVGAFEDAFARIMGEGRCFFVPSARSGLFVLLKSLELPAGSSVILPAWTHPSVPAAVLAAGLTPAFVDVDPLNLNIDPAAIGEEILGGAKAIVATHLYGTPCPLDDIISLAKAHGLAVIEDCAQALGATYRGKRVGTFGDGAYFSFALTKNFTTLGGGAVLANSPALAERVARLTAEGAEKKPVKEVVKAAVFAVGTSPLVFSLTLSPLLRLVTRGGRDPLHEAFREAVCVAAPSLPLKSPSPVKAALGLRQLKTLDARNAERRKWGTLLREELSALPPEILPAPLPDTEPIFMSFVLKVAQRQKVAYELLRRGVDSSPGYLGPCYRLPAFSQLSRRCPVAEEMADRQLHLPLYPALSEEKVRHMARSLEAVLSR